MSKAETITYCLVGLLAITALLGNVYIFINPNSWIAELNCRIHMFSSHADVPAYCLERFLK